MTKPAFASHIMLSDIVRAEAGSPEAVLDNRMAAVYTAAYHVLKSGNKTQFNLLTAACATYADIKACKEALATTTTSAPVKRMHAVYLAYGAALSACGVPSLMKGAEHDAIDDAAACYATEFATLVTVALTPEAKVVKSAEEKAAAKAEKEAKAQAAQAEADAAEQAAIDAKVAEIAVANALTMADMVQAVINAITLGMATPDQLTAISDALDAVAVDIAYVPVTEEVAVHA